MKAEILQLLRERGDFVSGQELCERFQVSRTAVWKSIQQLQKEGYQIEAVTRRGYRLDGFPDTVAAAEVESRLHTQWIGRPVRYFEEITAITGIVLTKLDGTAKGGIAIAIQSELGFPVKYIGVGEQIDDMQRFNSAEFVDALFADD